MLALVEIPLLRAKITRASKLRTMAYSTMVAADSDLIGEIASI